MKALKKVKTMAKPKPLVSIKKKKSSEDVKELKKVKKSVANGDTPPLKPKKPKTKESEAHVSIQPKKSKTSTEKSTKKEKSVKKAKKSNNTQLEGLKDIDPEFYNFLKQNDKKLLEFNMLDSDDEDDEDEEPAVEEAKPQKGKKAAADSEDEEDDDEPMEEASDESDSEEDDDEEDVGADGTQKVTLNLLRQWQQHLQQPNVSLDVVRKVIQAFSSALTSISADEEQAKAPSAFKVVGSAAFNGVVQLCVLHLQPAILKVLGLNERSKTPLHKTKKWVKVRGCLRYYLTDLIRLVEQVSSANILSVLLKHLHQMAGMLASFTALGKTILKRLIVLWATGDETVRVLAFLCILKITRSQQVSMLNHVLKAMYLSYVRNSKFVSPNTLPGINFMRRSLVEMFALDLNVSYQHAFLYIRQLAIHLRNAVILKKKDSFQAVYNWQFVNSLRLWTDLLGATTNKPQLQPLVYPLVTITLGVIRLIPTAQYFPLRFHCIQALIGLAKQAHIFVPVLPLILEVLRSNTFTRKHTAVSMRPVQFTCILRLNKAQLSENGFRDEVVEQVNALTLEYLSYESASFAFPDLVVPTVMTLKAYLKDCRNANYSRKLKQLLDKIQENARFVDQERRKVTFGLGELAQVQAWETQLRNKGTPLAIYYESWVKTHEVKKRRQAAQADSSNADYDGPSNKAKDGEVELESSDSEDDGPAVSMDEDDDEAEHIASSKSKKNKKTKKDTKTQKGEKKNKKQPAAPSAAVEEDDEPNADECVDIVKDLDMDDW